MATDVRLGQAIDGRAMVTPRKPSWSIKLQRARKAKKLSQDDAAARSGIGKTTWGNAELGTVRVSKGVRREYVPEAQTLAAMAVTVGLDPMEFVAEAGRNPDEVELETLPIALEGVPAEVQVFVVQVKGQPLNRQQLAEYVYKRLLQEPGEGADR